MADISYLRTEQGWVCVPAALDLFSRKVVGWSVNDSIATDLVSLEDARRSVFEYIVTFYHSKRIHQALGYRTPDQFEADHAPAVAV